MLSIRFYEHLIIFKKFLFLEEQYLLYCKTILRYCLNVPSCRARKSWCVECDFLAISLSLSLA